MFEIVKVILIFGLISLSLSFDTRISIRDVATCRHEHKHMKGDTNYTNFIPLSSFLYGIRPYEKRLTFYYKGKKSFFVMFSKKPEMPPKTEKAFLVGKLDNIKLQIKM